ncbi:condensation domain-containing protein, partial [Massilia aurea]|uniref:condensation domain-containing protein n=1 Tax=Massilia aurea TaxID=373040 RepID=UPI0031D47D3D
MALRATLDRIVARHEALRTCFLSNEAAEPMQMFAPADCGFSLVEHDLRGRLQPDDIAAWCANEVRQPFDLANGPLVRGQLLRLADHEHLLLLTQHHIVTDGWSIGVIVKEIAALYAAFSQNKPDPLPPLTIQYADYAAWQRQRLQGEAL